MAHPEQAEFLRSVRDFHPEAFNGASVLEIGSLDINGTVRDLFQDCRYVGVDLELGPGVDRAVQGQLVDFPSGSFDVTLSAECLEHNPYWRETLANMFRMTRPDGLVLMTCATTGRKEHGTTRTNPDASPFTSAAGWTYYRNLTARDLQRTLNLDGWLSDRASWVNHITKDLYFIGLRQGSGRRLDPALRARLDERYAMTADARTLRRGLKTLVKSALGSRQ